MYIEFPIYYIACIACIVCLVNILNFSLISSRERERERIKLISKARRESYLKTFLITYMAYIHTYICMTHTPVMRAYVYFIHVYLHRQTDKQSGNQTASQTGGTGDWGCPVLWVRGASTLLSASHVMNNCNLYFILLVYYSLSMARFTWLWL